MSNILVQTKIQSLVFKKYQNVVAISHYKNDVLINTFYLNAQLFKNIQLTLMHFCDALTRIKAYHDRELARLFPELTPVKIKNPPTVNTDNKTVATGEQVGVVDSVGDALFNTLEISLLRQVFNSFDLMSLPANFEAGSQLFALKQKIDLLHFKNFPKGV